MDTFAIYFNAHFIFYFYHIEISHENAREQSSLTCNRICVTALQVILYLGAVYNIIVFNHFKHQAEYLS